jgi:hypothetical protein
MSIRLLHAWPEYSPADERERQTGPDVFKVVAKVIVLFDMMDFHMYHKIIDIKSINTSIKYFDLILILFAHYSYSSLKLLEDVGMQAIKFYLNGVPRKVLADPKNPLLQLIRLYLN